MIIRSEQLATFEQYAWTAFEQEMVTHATAFAPQLCAAAAGNLIDAIRTLISQAQTYGFTNRGPIRLFIELALLCGSAFDTDPQYTAIGHALRSSEEQMVRAYRIHEEHNVYMAEVAGPRGEYQREALAALQFFLRTPNAPQLHSERETHRLAEATFPEKSRYVGEKNLAAFILESRIQATRFGFRTSRQVSVVALLNLAFGHGCAHDPFYPWIAQSLQDGEASSSAVRAVRLEASAVAWLERVLPAVQQGLPA